MLSVAQGSPVQATLSDVPNALDSSLFSACFTTWIETLRETMPDIVQDTPQSRRLNP